MKISLLYDQFEDRLQAEETAKGRNMPLVYQQVQGALTGAGHDVTLLPAPSDIFSLSKMLNEDRSDLIFNLCESLGGEGQHEQKVVAMLELLGKRFTGSGSIGIALAQDKGLAKKLFQFSGLTYPKFTVLDRGEADWSDDLKFPVIVKPTSMDASIGIDQSAIVHSLKDLVERISHIHRELNDAALIEEYIEGRELYVGIIGNVKPEALPILEWDFSDLPPDTPKIASSEAKWDQSSPGYKAPQRFPHLEEELVTRIQQAALTAYRALKLRDYARIDIRLSEKGASGSDIYIIEANPNPYLEETAEFMLAAKERGLSAHELILKIVDCATARALE